MDERRQTDRIGRRIDTHPDLRVAARAADQWGVLSLDELRGCGLSARAVFGRRRRGLLHRLHERVYAVGHPNPPWEGRMLAAVKACGPGAILSHMSAAMLWGFADRDEERAPEVTVVGDGARSHPGIRVHRTARIDGCDWRVWQAIPATTPARTMLDISATVDGKPLRSLVRRAQGTGSVGLRQLCEVVERLGPRKGSRRLALAIVGGPAPTRSVLEDIVLDLLLDAGFERPDINKPIVVGGRRVIPDFRWPDQHLIIEADSAAWHDGKAATEADAERQALLEAQGERVIRVTWHQALLTPELTRRRIEAAGAPPAR